MYIEITIETELGHRQQEYAAFYQYSRATVAD